MNPIRFFARVLRFFWRQVISLFVGLVLSIPYFHFIRNTRDYQSPNTLRYWFFQKVLGVNGSAPWPVHYASKVTNPGNISVGIDANPGYEPGCYIQGVGTIVVGDYTQVAQNVGIISGNHDVYDLRSPVPSSVRIGAFCWLGMNSVVLPGVVLGDFTIVGAGAVVTKSFSDGHCVIGGNPAKCIRLLDRNRCVRYSLTHEYVGYKRK
jgi:acetyltransferase-like isoleucine patch superfamily enzyme